MLPLFRTPCGVLVPARAILLRILLQHIRILDGGLPATTTQGMRFPVQLYLSSVTLIHRDLYSAPLDLRQRPENRSLRHRGKANMCQAPTFNALDAVPNRQVSPRVFARQSAVYFRHSSQILPIDCRICSSSHHL